MAHTFTDVQAFTAPIITEFKATITGTVLNGQTLSLLSGGAPDLAISEIFDPEAGKKVEFTVTISAKEVDDV